MKRIALLLFLAVPLWAGDTPPYKAGTTAVDENFRDIYEKTSGHLHDGKGSERLRDALPDTDSLYDLGASGREWANLYVDTVTAATGTFTNLIGTTATITNLVLNGNALTPSTQAQQETGTSTTTFVSPGRQQYHKSAAKAWVNFNGTGTVSIRDSYNVSSITDNGTGDYTINFTVAFSTSAYAGVFSCTNEVNAQHANGYITSQSTTAFRFIFHNSANSGQTADKSIVNAIFFGDQ